MYDPVAMDNARCQLTGQVEFADNAKDCLEIADVVVITTPWPEFQQISPQDLKQTNGKTTIFDCWRLLSQDRFTTVADYRSIGLGPQPDYKQLLYSAANPQSLRKEHEMKRNVKIAVTGAGGFIGHHLVTYLKNLGYWVRGIDMKIPDFTTTDADEFEILDLRRWDSCLQATRNVDEVYALAADMGDGVYLL